MLNPRVDKCSPAAGFTLIEVVVALVILSLSLSIIFAGLSADLRTKRIADDDQQATLLAESKLNSMGVERPLQEGITVGRFDDRFSWRVKVAPYREKGTDDLKKSLLVPLVVAVTVSWGGRGDGGSVSITTLRLVSP